MRSKNRLLCPVLGIRRPTARLGGALALAAILGGCATSSEWTREEQADYTEAAKEQASNMSGAAAGRIRERGIEMQLLIRNSELPLTDPRLADRVWQHYLTSREQWRAEEDHSSMGLFPASELYDPAIAYFSGIGQTGRVLQVLDDAAKDARRSNAFGFWRRYKLGMVSQARQVGNGPVAIAALDEMAERYYIPREPESGLSRETRAWTAYLLSQRYAAMNARSIDADALERDAHFVLETVKDDQQFRLPYLCCGVPALKVLRPLIEPLARSGSDTLHQQLTREIEAARQTTLALQTSRDFVAPTGTSIFSGFGSGNNYGAMLLKENFESSQQTESPYQKSWPLFRTAIAQWEGALYQENRAEMQKYLRRARARMQKLEAIYAVKGQRFATADGLERARKELQLAEAREAELEGDYRQAIAGYREVVAWSEQVRESLDPDQRLYFFQGAAKPAYLGLIRGQAKRVDRGASVGDDLLAAIQSYRGRQLLEQIPGSDAAREAPALADIQGDLAAGDLRMVVLDLETEWLTVLIDRSGMRLAFQSDERRVRELARTARRQLVKGGGGEGRAQLLDALLGDELDRLSRYDTIGAVTDGLVSLVPLEALFIDDEPLVASHEIRYFPTLGTSAGERRGAGADEALIVADPAYETVASAGAAMEEGTRGLRAANAGGYFTPLPETLEEAAAVKASLSGYRARQLSGESATEPAVREALRSGPGLAHFATHGILSGDLPGLNEAALVLASTDDSDGLLTASEIAELPLDLRLAVLSACNTGNGEQIAGEGLVGVSRAFLTAGTDAVVASLWPVDSQATVALMEAFYEELGAGRAPAEALRAAKLSLREAQLSGDGDVRALKRKDTVQTADGAYFWSPFILVTLEG